MIIIYSTHVHKYKCVCQFIPLFKQADSSQDRHLAFVDKNRDVFLTHARKSQRKIAKLGTMVQTMVSVSVFCLLCLLACRLLVFGIDVIGYGIIFDGGGCLNGGGC